MSPARRLIALGALVLVAAGIVWLILRPGTDRPHGPEAISKVAGWLEEESECPEGVELEASRIPVAPQGPPGTFFQTFGELPQAGALTACTDTASGFIGWFRFADAVALNGALRRHPEITMHEPICTRGREVLIDSLLGNDRFFPEFCRRLGFKEGAPTG